MFDNIKVDNVTRGGLEYGAISFTLSKSSGFVWNNLNVPVVQDGNLVGVLRVSGSKTRGIEFVFDKKMAEELLHKNGVHNPELPNGEAIPVTQLPFAKTWIFEGPEGVHIYLNANPRVDKMLIGFAVPVKELSKVSQTMTVLTVLNVFQMPFLYNATQALLMGSSGFYFNPVTKEGGICSFVEVPNIIHKRENQEKIDWTKSSAQFSEKKEISLSEKLALKKALSDKTLSLGN